jgi:hypothetical protein
LHQWRKASVTDSDDASPKTGPNDEKKKPEDLEDKMSEYLQYDLTQVRTLRMSSGRELMGGCVDSDPEPGSTFGVGVDQPLDGIGSALVRR